MKKTRRKNQAGNSEPPCRTYRMLQTSSLACQPLPPLLVALTPYSRPDQQLKLIPLYSACMITPIVNMLVGRCAFECLKVYLAWDGLYRDGT